MTQRHRLIVMRHAKAEPYAATDRERRLTDRGRRDARATGEYLASRDWLPDHALVSSSARTRDTWDAVADGAGAGAEVWFDDAVYSGSPDVVLEALRAVPEEARTLIFVGHNPTAAYLAHLLDDGNGDTAALSGMLSGFPPGSVACLEVAVPWVELAPETGRIVDFHAGGA